MKTVEIPLPYFKQGDDFRAVSQRSQNNGEALKLHADILRKASNRLHDVRAYIDLLPAKDQESITIEGDTHLILLTGPDRVCDFLIKVDLASEPFDSEHDMWEEEEPEEGESS